MSKVKVLVRNLKNTVYALGKLEVEIQHMNPASHTYLNAVGLIAKNKKEIKVIEAELELLLVD